ncbi:MAG: amidohydrolase [Acidobacteria bacterium Pan2503]|uniref:Amidohydrolase n=1 Tax=Candidatus Acidiferrum panamense TaxID=2741543 RepID=A0A7V8NVG5_9BACT|nr:amidohydrolase [Candidatus Acidoferrum panamensis]
MILVFSSASAYAQQPSFADLVIVHGHVWTVDPRNSRAEAVAIHDGHIVRVGSDAEIAKWVGPATKRIDAQGKSVLPGFIDAHVHFSSGGGEISGVHLRDANTPQEFARRIGEQAKKLAKGEWMLGGTWDHELWGGTPLPSHDWVDALTPDTPVFVSRYDGHMAMANALALRLAGVTRETEDPPGGTIVRGKDGNPTGLLKDAAMNLVYRIIPPPSEEQLLRMIRAAMEEARRFGVTSIHDISSTEDVRAYQTLADRGELTLRIYSITPLPQWQAPATAGIRAGFGNDWIHLGALKGFADGSLGSTTALFEKPYDDAPETSGLPNEMMLPEGNMLKMALGADKAGLQLAVHAIGDKANRILLDIYAEVEKQNGARTDRRWRIEHAQHLRPEDFARFAQLGVIASVQPYHAIDDGRWAEKRIGHERAKTTYAFRTLLDHGVRLAFGSDWTVAPLNPMVGLYAAVTRATLDGKNPGGWFPEQRLTLEEALQAYTMGSAFAEFREREKGSLTPGKLADLVVLDRDLFAIAQEKIKDAAVRYTIVGGRVVYQAGKN